jgi:hypothetical protein
VSLRSSWGTLKGCCTEVESLVVTCELDKSGHPVGNANNKSEKQNK